MLSGKICHVILQRRPFGKTNSIFNYVLTYTMKLDNNETLQLENPTIAFFISC